MFSLSLVANKRNTNRKPWQEVKKGNKLELFNHILFLEKNFYPSSLPWLLCVSVSVCLYVCMYVCFGMIISCDVNFAAVYVFEHCCFFNGGRERAWRQKNTCLWHMLYSTFSSFSISLSFFSFISIFFHCTLVVVIFHTLFRLIFFFSPTWNLHSLSGQEIWENSHFSAIIEWILSWATPIWKCTIHALKNKLFLNIICNCSNVDPHRVLCSFVRLR